MGSRALKFLPTIKSCAPREKNLCYNAKGNEPMLQCANLATRIGLAHSFSPLVIYE